MTVFTDNKNPACRRGLILNLFDVVKSAIKRTAEKTGKTAHEVTIDFIEGKAPLWGLAGVLGSNALFWEDDNFPESTSPM